MEKVATGVTCHTQLGKHRELNPFVVKLTEHVYYSVGVGPHIRHPDGGDACRHSEKAVAHIFYLVVRNFVLKNRLYI